MNRGFKGVWMPRDVYLDRRLTEKEKFLLVEIDQLDNEEGCFAGNEHFAEFLNVTVRRVQQMLSKLREYNYIVEFSLVVNRKRIIISKLLEVCAENSKEDLRNKFHGGVKDVSWGGEINCIHNKTINKTSNNIKKTYKKENDENHIPDTRKMVETKSKISCELLGNSEQLEKDFGSTWRYFFDEYKKSGKPAGSKSEAKNLFLKNLKKYKIEEIKQSVHNYVQDCAIRGYGFKHLTSFLSISKNHIEEWKNGSENHQALLEIKSKPVNVVKNERGLESSKEKLDRNVKEYNNKTSAIFDEVFKNQESEDLRLN